MPRPKKPPRLALRKYADGTRRWEIRDGERSIRTGFLEENIEDAEARLANYISEKRKPATKDRHSNELLVADVLIAYRQAKAHLIARPKELDSRLGFINEFFGAMPLSDVRGESCRDYAAHRPAQAARRELEDLRAAINHWHREFGLDIAPKITLPEKAAPRTRWLTRSEAARLLRAANALKRSRPAQYSHLIRFILIGLYTGTRHEAICRLQWRANTGGGHADLERGVLYRRAEGQRETAKRKPPMRLPRKLIGHMRRWHRADGPVPFIIHRGGEPVGRIERSLRTAADLAGLSNDVTAHTFRHTRATWLAQVGVPVWEAAGSLGMTVEMFERTYGHHHPDFQRAAADAY
ncbi:integrase [Zhengella mangrovi]|uniref:Integrase n=1 Tax=Zhengella mangrovi TaxID=1982044 RepID=A0A2G1QMU4_9HYPH|nr:tyrosine-type recombinase/integrase [Zhengella mangrovi]PHP66770.1 integrase [Zhengella mangrovi]